MGSEMCIRDSLGNLFQTTHLDSSRFHFWRPPLDFSPGLLSWAPPLDSSPAPVVHDSHMVSLIFGILDSSLEILSQLPLLDSNPGFLSRTRRNYSMLHLRFDDDRSITSML